MTHLDLLLHNFKILSLSGVKMGFAIPFLKNGFWKSQVVCRFYHHSFCFCSFPQSFALFYTILVPITWWVLEEHCISRRTLRTCLAYSHDHLSLLSQTLLLMLRKLTPEVQSRPSSESCFIFIVFLKILLIMSVNCLMAFNTTQKITIEKLKH